MMKKLRPRVWLSLIVTLFGITVRCFIFSSQIALSQNVDGRHGTDRDFRRFDCYASLVGCLRGRCKQSFIRLEDLLTLTQLFPGAAYLLSLWYPRSLLQFRIAM